VGGWLFIVSVQKLMLYMTLFADKENLYFISQKEPNTQQDITASSSVG